MSTISTSKPRAVSVTISTARALAGTGRPTLAEMLIGGKHATTHITVLAQLMLAHVLDRGSNIGGQWLASATVSNLATLSGVSCDQASAAAAELANLEGVTVDSSKPDAIVSVRRRSEPLVNLPARCVNDAREKAARNSRFRRLITVPTWWPTGAKYLTRSAIGRLSLIELTQEQITQALNATHSAIATSRDPVQLLDKNLRRAANVATA